MRPRMFEVADRGEAFALATIVAADGGPRPEGAQMVVTRAQSWGFLSGGCIEEDVARNGREVLKSGQTRTLVYGKGSPFIDIRLPCGGRIEVAIERVAADDPALSDLRALTKARVMADWISDGVSRNCENVDDGEVAPNALIHRRYAPAQRLIVAGTDPFALAIAGLGQSIGWETVLLAPNGPREEPPLHIKCDRRPLREALAYLKPDAMTAIAVATHDLERDEEALVPALRSAAGYVGVLGSRRKLDERHERLSAAGLAEAAIARLKAPIGLDIGAASPWEVGIAVVGEIIAERRRRSAASKSDRRRVVAAA